MTQTTNRIFDELAKLMTDAAGAADGVRHEVDNVMRSQAERVLQQLDVVQREEFEVVKLMAQKARQQNESLDKENKCLAKRIKQLEEKLASLDENQLLAHKSRPVRRP